MKSGCISTMCPFYKSQRCKWIDPGVVRRQKERKTEQKSICELYPSPDRAPDQVLCGSTLSVCLYRVLCERLWQQSAIWAIVSPLLADVCLYVYIYFPLRQPETQKLLFFPGIPSYSIPIRKRKKTSCDWLWFQCHSLDVLDVKLFLIGTHLMNWWWWVDRRREGLYIQQLIGLLFSDTKWSGWMELFVSSLTKWFLLYLGYICLAL